MISVYDSQREYVDAARRGYGYTTLREDGRSTISWACYHFTADQIEPQTRKTLPPSSTYLWMIRDETLKSAMGGAVSFVVPCTNADKWPAQARAEIEKWKQGVENGKRIR